MQFFFIVCVHLPPCLSVCLHLGVCVRCEGMLQALCFQVLFSENREIAYLNAGVIWGEGPHVFQRNAGFVSDMIQKIYKHVNSRTLLWK